LETRHVKAALSAMVVKTDLVDAPSLAQLLHMGWFRPVHLPDPKKWRQRPYRLWIAIRQPLVAGVF